MKIKKMLLIVLTLVLCFTFAISCGGTPDPAPPPQTPVAADYDISNLTQTAGSIIAVTITPKTDKSSGARTIYYNGSTTLPSAVGTYSVTFDVAEAAGWNAASGLSAGTLTINATNQTPVAADFDIGNLSQTVGNISAVTITPKSGKSSGAITIYYNGVTTRPTTAGRHSITFDVAAATGWNAARGLSAGTLTITDPTPTSGIILDGAQTYTVVRGDTLSRIAARFYGRGYYYPIIYFVSDEVEDIDVIEVGMRLTIPSLQVNINDPSSSATIKNWLVQAAQINESKGRTDDAAALRRLANGM